MKKIKCSGSKPGAFYVPIDRRRFFKSMAIASAGFSLPGYLAEALRYTPEVTQGPYYPLSNNIPLDKDNYLIYSINELKPGMIITYVTGRVLDASGNPVNGALVELWHADAGGNYLYAANSARNPAADTNLNRAHMLK